METNSVINEFELNNLCKNVMFASDEIERTTSSKPERGVRKRSSLTLLGGPNSMRRRSQTSLLTDPQVGDSGGESAGTVRVNGVVDSADDYSNIKPELAQAVTRIKFDPHEHVNKARVRTLLTNISSGLRLSELYSHDQCKRLYQATVESNVVQKLVDGIQQLKSNVQSLKMWEKMTESSEVNEYAAYCKRLRLERDEQNSQAGIVETQIAKHKESTQAVLQPRREEKLNSVATTGQIYFTDKLKLVQTKCAETLDKQMTTVDGISRVEQDAEKFYHKLGERHERQARRDEFATLTDDELVDEMNRRWLRLREFIESNNIRTSSLPSE